MKQSIFIPVALFVALVFVGCGGGKLPENQGEQAQLPEDHPPIGQDVAPQGSLGSDGPTDEHPLPLKLTGLNSAEELERALAGTENPEAREVFELGFRKTFTAQDSKRDYAGAVADLERALALDPDFAEAYRALGYARFNTGFDVDAAMTNYLKAVEIKPDYGEAHYALAFMYAMGDRSKGESHYKKAMELGIVDERNLGDRFYNAP